MKRPINHQDSRLQSKQRRQDFIIEGTCYKTMVNATKIENQMRLTWKVKFDDNFNEQKWRMSINKQ